MKIDIIGHHPILQPGFCAVMSLYEGMHLSYAGHDVRLVTPFRNEKDLELAQKRRGIPEVNLLERNLSFEIHPMILSEEIKLRSTDATIWQITNVARDTNLLQLSRENCKVFSKNYPKYIPGKPIPLPVYAKAQFECFDLVTLSLKEDYQAIWQYRNFALNNQHKFCYVPRGADSELLHDAAKSSTPIIAIDTPNARDFVGIEHLFEPLRLLKKRYSNLKVINFGGPDLPLDFAETLRPPMRHEVLCQKFFNPAWIYCVVDYSQSPPHIKGEIHSVDRTWDSKAIFEMQTVESQMAGCIIAGYKKNIIRELVDYNFSAIWNDFESEEQITESLYSAMRNREKLGFLTRERAKRKFEWKDSILSWEYALRNLVENGYDRSQKIHSVIPSTDQNGGYLQQNVLFGSGPKAQDINRFKISMEKNENRLMYELADRSRRIVDFGCHESIKIMSSSRADNIDVIETEWKRIKKLNSIRELKCQIKANRICIHHIDIGPTNEQGYPVELNHMQSARYSKSPWTKVPLSEVDLVQVSGRFRVVTALEAALRTNLHCLIIVPDYQHNEFYEIIQEHLTIHARAGNLFVFAKGKNWNRDEAFQAAENFRLDPR